MGLKIRPLSKDSFDLWLPLFQGFCHFYNQACDIEKGNRIWNWLHDEDHILQGIAAFNDKDDMLGFAHYHAWPVSIYGSDVCYLSDLFVSPMARGERVGKSLFKHLLNHSKTQGWPALTLLTQENNTIGRSLYDQFGERTEFCFYSAETCT